MDQTPAHQPRAVWAFWIACGLAVVAAVAPFLLGGGSNRITTAAVVSFALGAVAFGACALLHRQGRPITTLLYIVASLAVVYGILSMLALPLRLAVLGTCPGPGACGLGLERPMTTAETSALGFSIGIGIVAILTGFFGLHTLYERSRARRPTDTSTTPPARRIPPVTTKSEATTTPAPSPTPAAKPSETSTAVIEAPAQPEPEPETPAPAAELDELPAHEPDLELPAHATDSAKAAESTPAVESSPVAADVAPMPAPQRPRRQRKPKAPPEPPTTGTE